MKKIILSLSVFVTLVGCSKKDAEPVYNHITITSQASSLQEGSVRNQILISLQSPLKDTAVFDLALDSSSATYGVDYFTVPAAVNNSFSFKLAPGSSQYTFQVSVRTDAISDPNEIIKCFLKNLPNGYKLDHSISITITDNTLGNGLVGEYLFDGNANDTSPNLNNGTVNGAVAGPDHLNSGNYAYSFNGINDYVMIPGISALNFPGNSDFTISVWASVAFPQESPTNQIFDIVRKWTGDAQGYPFAIAFLNDQASQPNRFIFARYDGSSCYNVPTLYSGLVTAEGYHHIILSKSGSTLTAFVDNTMVSQVTDFTVCDYTNNSAVTVGCRGQLARFFKGEIDDLRFYSRALTADEIGLLFHL